MYKRRVVERAAFVVGGQETEGGGVGRVDGRRAGAEVEVVVLPEQRVLVGAGGRNEHGIAREDGDGGGSSAEVGESGRCLLYTSPSPRERTRSRMTSFA